MLDRLSEAEPAAAKLLARAVDRLRLSSRGYHHIPRVARTLGLKRLIRRRGSPFVPTR